MSKEPTIKARLISVFQLTATDGRFIGRALSREHAEQLKVAFDTSNPPCTIREQLAMLLPEKLRLASSNLGDAEQS
jgi:uncharacterized protein (UPF0218 family)